jgi:hypothetical protein
MRSVAFLAFMLLSIEGQAELYRWIDPDSGSVKYSNLPPSDERARPELMPFKAPAVAPAAPVAAAAPGGEVVALEARWSALVAQLAAMPPQELLRGGDAVRRQVEAFEALTAQLDRLDPAGTPRRIKQLEPLAERLKQK